MLALPDLAEKLPTTDAGLGRCAVSGGPTDIAPVSSQPVAVDPATPGCSKPGLVISEFCVVSLPA